jgi:hypothetical protein
MPNRRSLPTANASTSTAPANATRLQSGNSSRCGAITKLGTNSLRSVARAPHDPEPSVAGAARSSIAAQQNPLRAGSPLVDRASIHAGRAADLLGINGSALHCRMKKLGLGGARSFARHAP